jgi:hypothetical protein
MWSGGASDRRIRVSADRCDEPAEAAHERPRRSASGCTLGHQMWIPIGHASGQGIGTPPERRKGSDANVEAMITYAPLVGTRSAR